MEVFSLGFPELPSNIGGGGHCRNLAWRRSYAFSRVFLEPVHRLKDLTSRVA